MIYIKNYSGRLAGLKLRSDLKSVPFNLDVDDVKKIYDTRKCFYCEKIIMAGRRQIDRIIPSKGYTKNNCVSCCKSCNDLKGTMVKGNEKYYRMIAILKKINEN